MLFILNINTYKFFKEFIISIKNHQLINNHSYNSEFSIIGVSVVILILLVRFLIWAFKKDNPNITNQNSNKSESNKLQGKNNSLVLSTEEIINHWNPEIECEYYTKVELNDAKKLIQLKTELDNKKMDFDNYFSALSDIYSRIPTNYENSFISEGCLYIKCWDTGDFIKKYLNEKIHLKNKYEITGIYDPYPRCCHLLSNISIQKNDFHEAKRYTLTGLTLDPENLILLNEHAYINANLGRITQDKDYYNLALDIYNKIYLANRMDSKSWQSLALRGIGSINIEQKDYEKAELNYKESLTLEISEVAEQQLIYISYKKIEKELINRIGQFDNENFIEIYGKSVVFDKDGLIRHINRFDNNEFRDFFGFVSSSDTQILETVEQIKTELRGICPAHPIKNLNDARINDLLVFMNFIELENINIETITNEHNESIKKVTFYEINELVTMYIMNNEI